MWFTVLLGHFMFPKYWRNAVALWITHFGRNFPPHRGEYAYHIRYLNQIVLFDSSFRVICTLKTDMFLALFFRRPNLECSPSWVIRCNDEPLGASKSAWDQWGWRTRAKESLKGHYRLYRISLNGLRHWKDLVRLRACTGTPRLLM